MDEATIATLAAAMIQHCSEDLLSEFLAELREPNTYLAQECKDALTSILGHLETLVEGDGGEI